MKTVQKSNLFLVYWLLSWISYVICLFLIMFVKLLLRVQVSIGFQFGIFCLLTLVWNLSILISSNKPGRKSDVKDAEWIATVLQKGLIRGSYVPDRMIQCLRQYERRNHELSKNIVHAEQRMDMILQRCNIRISNYVSASPVKVIKRLSTPLYRERVIRKYW